MRLAAIAALLCALAVALGAFGAHALKERVPEADLAIWHTAVLYHLFHALALLALGLWGRAGSWAPGCLLAGLGIFSGSLYVLVLSGARWLGAITPIGGVLFLLGWCLLAGRLWCAAKESSAA